MKKTSFFVASILMAGSVCAQGGLVDGVGGNLVSLLPEGVKANIPYPKGSSQGYRQNDLVVAGSPENGYKAYFRAGNAATTGDELWVTDGTAEGTKLVKDIRPGATGSFVKNIARFNDKVVFGADDGAGVAQLWISDGTEEGTVKLAEVIDPMGFTQLNETQFVFGAKRTKDDKSVLYVSDGTPDGTKMIMECATAFPGDYRSTSFTMPWCRVGRQVFFKADSKDAKYGVELWVTDGTSKGTRLVKDICEGNTKSGLDQFVNFYNEKLFFAANDGVHGEEPWATDGTAEGTYMIKDTNPSGGGMVSASGILPYAGKIWYRGKDNDLGPELFGTDLTEGNMTILKANRNEYDGGDSSSANPQAIIPFDGMLVFNANTGKDVNKPETNFGAEMQYTDGETVYFPNGWDLAPGASKSHFADDPIVVAGSLYWRNTGNMADCIGKLYRLNAIDQMPERVTEGNGYIHSLCNIGGALVFATASEDKANVTTDGLYCYTYQKPGYDAEKDADNLEPEYRTRKEIEDDEVTTAVAEHGVEAVALYPNPTSGEFSFTIEGHALSVKIFDTLGRLVKEEPLSGNTVDVATLANGMYKVLIATTEGSAVSSLVINK